MQGEADNNMLSIKLSDICLATSAAPTYFPSYHFKVHDKDFNCIDGGMAANNPVRYAYT